MCCLPSVGFHQFTELERDIPNIRSQRQQIDTKLVLRVPWFDASDVLENP
jgi:hypothetical protein